MKHFTDDYLVASHAYTVLAVARDSSGNPATVTLRNPWGVDGGHTHVRR